MKQFRIMIFLAGCLVALAACNKDYEAIPLEKVTIEYVFDKDDSLGTYANKFLNSYLFLSCPAVTTVWAVTCWTLHQTMLFPG